jgi:anti-sigma factor RsiW
VPRGPEQLRLSPDERDNLVAYVDGELPESVSRAIATKLTHSETARREVEMLKRTWELLGHLAMPQVAGEFSQRTVTQILQLESKSRAWDSWVGTWAGRAASIVAYLVLGTLAVGGGYAAARWLWPDPSARLARELSLAENLDAYLEIGTFDFLSQLADSPEFGSELP